jgi:hypothetical protein
LITLIILDYLFCRIHDFDKNDKLDGLEVLKAVNHVMAGVRTTSLYGNFFLPSIFKILKNFEEYLQIFGNIYVKTALASTKIAFSPSKHRLWRS